MAASFFVLGLGLGCKSRAKNANRADPQLAELEKRLARFQQRARYAVLTPAVLASIADEDLEQAVLDHILDVRFGDAFERDHEIVSTFSPGLRMFYATFILEGEVNNGGYHQFFFNSSRRFAADAVAGYELLGAREHAELTRQAIALIAAEEAAERDAPDSESSEPSALGPIDERFFQLDARPRRIAYIRAHAAEFTSP